MILPDGERNASARRRRAISALGDSVIDRPFVWDKMQHRDVIDRLICLTILLLFLLLLGVGSEHYLVCCLLW